MRILILLTGKTYNPGMLPKSRVLAGTDLWGRTHIFDKLEFVNNLQTVAALQQQLPQHEVLVRHLLHRNNPAKLWQQANQLKQLVKQEKISLVHQFWGGPAAFFMSKKCRRVPYVLSLLGSDVMGTYSKEGKPSVKGKLLRLFSVAAAKHSSHVVVMSEMMKKSLPNSVQQKVTVLPEGVDFNKFYPIDQAEARAFLKWSPGERVILFFNNGNRVKNAAFAYKVFEEVRNILPNTSFVEVKGVDHRELLYYYNAADALLITSLHEGSNNSLKEAMACNCPVISSQTGDAAEKLTGVQPSAVLKGFESDDFCQALVQVLQGRQRSNGIEMAASFTTERIAMQLLQLYQKLVAQS